MTQSGNDFVPRDLLTPKNQFSGFMVDHMPMSSMVILAASFFEITCGKRDKQRDRHTHKRHWKPIDATAVDVGNKTMRYYELTAFSYKWRPSAILDFKKFEILTAGPVRMANIGLHAVSVGKNHTTTKMGWY